MVTNWASSSSYISISLFCRNRKSFHNSIFVCVYTSSLKRWKRTIKIEKNRFLGGVLCGSSGGDGGGLTRFPPEQDRRFMAKGNSFSYLLLHLFTPIIPFVYYLFNRMPCTHHFSVFESWHICDEI